MVKTSGNWGKKISIRDTKAAGLEELELDTGARFFIAPSFNGKELDEKATTVYWLVIKDLPEEKSYREVLGERKKQVLEEYLKQAR